VSVSAAAVVLRGGELSGRQGHLGEGRVALVQDGDAYALVFSEDFRSTPVPEPIVIFTLRESVGSAPDENAGDVVISTLLRASGAQAYAVPSASVGLRYVHVFCEPFGVEVARADLGAP
jgi:hypothetical protein